MQQTKQEENSRQNINNFNADFKTMSEKMWSFFVQKDILEQ